MQAEKWDGTKGPVTEFTKQFFKRAFDDPETKRIVISKLPDKGSVVTMLGIRFVVERWRSDHEDGITLTLRAVDLEGDE